jgi:hypothetical protein
MNLILIWDYILDARDFQSNIVICDGSIPVINVQIIYYDTDYCLHFHSFTAYLTTLHCQVIRSLASNEPDM